MHKICASQIMQQNTRQTRDFMKLWKLHYSYFMRIIDALYKLSMHYQFRDIVQYEVSIVQFATKFS